MAELLNIYHNRDECYNKELVELGKSSISPANKDLITRWQNYLFSREAKPYRVGKLSGQIRRLCELFGKDLDQATKEQIQGLVAQINLDKSHGDETRADYRRCLKQFYNWFRDMDPRLESRKKAIRTDTQMVYKYLRSEVKGTCKPAKVDPSNVLTDEDIDFVIEKGCRTIKEKAFIKTLHETGCRAGEFLNIKIKDVDLKQKPALIIVDGKTGERKIPVLHSMPYLVQWLGLHPFKDNRESYLWLGESLSNRYMPFKHRGAQKLINRCFERAGFIQREVVVSILESGKKTQKTISVKRQKPTNFHWFRHSRASLLASNIPEPLLCSFMGWNQGAKQVRRYVHLNASQLSNAILEMNGMETEGKKQTQKPPVCVCGAINPASGRYCYKCGNPLSVEIVINDQEKVRQEIDDRLKVYAEIMADPAKRQKFEEFKRLFFGKEIP